MIPTTLQLLITAPAYQVSQADQVQRAADTEHQVYTWLKTGASNRLESGIHQIPGALALLLIPTSLPATIHLPNDPDVEDRPLPRPACTCDDWHTTLHGGELHCPSFGGPSAHCAHCGGCKACRVLQVCGRYRPSEQRTQAGLHALPLTHPPRWTPSRTHPLFHHAADISPQGHIMCLIQPAQPSGWNALAVRIPTVQATPDQICTTHLGTHTHLGLAKDHVADWLDSLTDGPDGSAQGIPTP